MTRSKPDYSHRILMFSWTIRWGWILLAAISLAWGRETLPIGLWLTTLYGLGQIALTFLLFSGNQPGITGWMGLILDLSLPTGIALISAGQPATLPFLLLAPIVVLSLHFGSVYALVGGILIDAVVALVWLMEPAGLSIAVTKGPLGFLMGVVLAQVLAAGLIKKLVASGFNGLLVNRSARPDFPTVATELVDQLPPADLPMEGEQLLRTTLDLGLEVLIATGLQASNLAGLALLSDPDGLHEVGRRGAFQEEPYQFIAGEGALASARLHGSIENVPRLVSDAELCRLYEDLSWRSAACLPIEDGRRCLGVLVFGHPRRSAFDSEKLEGLHALAQQARLALRFAELYQEQVQERIRLGEIQEEARKKLARDLHDGPTQVIAAIAMRTNFARRQMTRDPASAQKELEKVEDMARLTTKEIRHMLFTLRPLILESQGLIAALRQYAEKVRETHNQQVLVEAEMDVENALSQASQVALFYIVEEAVTNAYKHAAAEHIWIKLQPERNGVIAEIKDDGVGFNVGEVDANYEHRGSLGMVTMRERTELFEGLLEIESELGQGTTIRVRIPVNNPATSG